MKPKITVRIAIFALPKQRAFPLNRETKKHNTNLDSASFFSHDESMPPLVPLQDGLDAIYCSANEDNSDKFISTNFTDSEYNTTEDSILFLQKYLYDLIRD